MNAFFVIIQIIYTYARRPGEVLWREAHVLQQTQCGHESDLDPVAVQSSAFLSLTVTNGTVTKRQRSPPRSKRRYKVFSNGDYLSDPKLDPCKGAK